MMVTEMRQGIFNLFVVKVARGLIRYANKMAVINGPRKL